MIQDTLIRSASAHTIRGQVGLPTPRPQEGQATLNLETPLAVQATTILKAHRSTITTSSPR